MCDQEFVLHLERDIEALLEKLSPNWTENEIDSVQEDLNYGEWDIALEQIAGIIVNFKKPLTSDVFSALVSLETRLDLQNSKFMQALHTYATSLDI